MMHKKYLKIETYKYKIWNYKTHRRKYRDKLLHIGSGNDFLC